MADKIQCATHGECLQTFVCTHLLGESAGLGFNRNEPDEEKPFPDAWCDNCEIIRIAHDGWNEESEKLSEISLLCSGCYERARIRNTRPSVTLDDLADLRWKCGTCSEWHTGPCLDFGVDSPYYWSDDHAKSSKTFSLLPELEQEAQKDVLGRGLLRNRGQGFLCSWTDSSAYHRRCRDLSVGRLGITQSGELQHLARAGWQGRACRPSTHVFLAEH